nr:ATP-binding protein [Streptomyces sp. NBC_01800]
MDGSVEHLGQLDFLTTRENVILLGPPGTGKTHLAGQRTLFATATRSPKATPAEGRRHAQDTSFPSRNAPVGSAQALASGYELRSALRALNPPALANGAPTHPLSAARTGRPGPIGFPHPVSAASLGLVRARCAAARPGAAGAKTEASPAGGCGARRACTAP